MAFSDDLQKVIRFPWDVEDRIQRGLPLKSMDKAIKTSLLTENRLDPCFLTAPDPALVQSIALPSIIAMCHSKDRYLAEYNPWRKGEITREEKIRILRYYHLKRDHEVVFQMVPRSKAIFPMASYMAATYAFSLNLVPYVLSLEELTDELRQSHWDREDTERMEVIKTKGLVVVTNILSHHPSVPKMDGLHRGFFLNRLWFGHTTVFIDEVPEEIAEVLEAGEFPERKEIRRILKETPLGEYKSIFPFVMGDHTYINFNVEEPSESLNDYREDLLI